MLTIFAPELQAQVKGSNQYGLLGLLDHRSQYGKGAFPEPFLVDDSDLEVNEFRLDWIHQEGKGKVFDGLTAEVEKGFGQLTVEVEVHYERGTEKSFNTDTHQTDFSRDEGIANVDIGVRYPLYQYVSNDEVIDNTLGIAFEVGIPTNSPISKNTELVPKFFDDLRIGSHFTLQFIMGYSFLTGSKPDGGSQALEYGLDLGWTIHHSELAIPGVQQLIPIFELSGETAMNNGESGQNNLVGTAGVRANLKPIQSLQPRLGVGYIFPMDKNARDEFRWGVVTSLVFEF